MGPWIPVEHTFAKIYYKYNTNKTINEIIIKCLIQDQENFHRWLAVKEEREVINTRDNIQVSVYTSALEIKEENADTEEYSEVDDVENINNIENVEDDENIDFVENLYSENSPKEEQQNVNGKLKTTVYQNIMLNNNDQFSDKSRSSNVLYTNNTISSNIM